MMAKCTAREKDEYFLYAWGANSYGQLGTGNKEDTFLPSKCLLDSEVVKRLTQITGGGGHTILLTDSGELYAFGWNKNGQLGFKPLDDVAIPRLLTELPVRVAKVACGWNHTLAVSDSGGLTVWGSNSFGQLGVPQIVKTSTPTMIPSEVFANSRVRDISAGLRHSVAVTEDGTVYSWGDGKKGQLGHGRNALGIHQSPTKVKPLACYNVVKVASGMYHSVAITVDGQVLSWGQNQYGECGLGELNQEVESLLKPANTAQTAVASFEASQCGTVTDLCLHFKIAKDTNWITNVYKPWKVQGLPLIESVQCGWSHNIAVTMDERVFSWGRSDDGQLGIDESCFVEVSVGTKRFCCCKPTEVRELRGARQVACGSAHNIVVGRDGGCVLTFGWNEHGMCGDGSDQSVLRPRSIGMSSAVTIGAGAGMTMVVRCSR